jgi:hypothetical protein
MKTFPGRAPITAFALPLTEELLTCSGITPGMRVLVLGRDVTDLALLVAERVGCEGYVLGAHDDDEAVADARARAADEGFERVDFSAASLDDLNLEEPLDAVVGRFLLMCESDPAEALRRAAGMVHDGGRVVFQEWHFDSITWSETSDWPHIPLYRRFVRLAIESMRRDDLHSDIGLRLANLFAEAGLSLPSIQSDLRIVNGASTLGYAFFESIIRELLPAIERHGLARQEEIDLDNFAARLKAETNAAGGHLFLPLQVGAWTRVDK